MTTVAITGASGFLGTALTKELSGSSIKVISLSRESGFNILNAEEMSMVPPFTHLIHLAAKTFVPDSYTNTAEFLNFNITSTVNCLDLCRRHNARFIFAGSYVYGPPQYLPVDENHPVNAWNPYATSKIVSETIAEMFSREFNIPVIIFRIFNLYGPGQPTHFLIPKIIEGILSGSLNLESDYPKRDFIFIDDVIKAFSKAIALNNTGFEVLNLGSGRSYSVKEIVDLCSAILKKEAKTTYRNEKRKNEITDVIADVAKARTILNWRPEISFEEGLKKIIG